MLRIDWVCWVGFAMASAFAAPIPPQNPAKPAPGSLQHRLENVRSRVMALEKTLMGSLKDQRERSGNIQKIQALMKLQSEERDLSIKRMRELETMIAELETRRGTLRERIWVEQLAIRRSLLELHRADEELPSQLSVEDIEEPRQEMLGRLVAMGVREVEALKVDLSDAEELAARIDGEREQLTVTMNELDAQKSVLQMNRELQLAMVQKNHESRVAQWEQYRKLKVAELEVERMIKEFSARMELQDAVRTEQAERRALYSLANAPFARAKGKLPLPVEGRILAQYGKSFDTRAQLPVFKKGIEISAVREQPVRAVFGGKVAFVGELPNYGRIAILDHGDHFYTLVGHLGEIARKSGDVVSAGDSLGKADIQGSPIYFEVRARNLPVNPLQWVAKSFSLK